MKKLALVVFLGLGLLRAESVESAKTDAVESVCGNVDMGSIYLSDRLESIARFFYKVDSREDKEKFEKQYLSSEDKIYKLNGLVLSLLGAKTYYTEIKRSDKESVCAYKLVFDYLNTQLTEQELERLERFAAESNAYDWYNRDDNKEHILYALKFIKYHNKIDELVYDRIGKNTRLDEYALHPLKELGGRLFSIAKYDMSIIKMVYGKVQIGYVYRTIGGTVSAEWLKDEIPWFRGTDKDKKELESIMKWGESIK